MRIKQAHFTFFGWCERRAVCERKRRRGRAREPLLLLEPRWRPLQTSTVTLRTHPATFRESYSKTSISCPRKRHQTKCRRLSEWWCFFHRGRRGCQHLGQTHKPSSPSAVRLEAPAAAASEEDKDEMKTRHEAALSRNTIAILYTHPMKMSWWERLRNYCPISLNIISITRTCLML